MASSITNLKEAYRLIDQINLAHSRLGPDLLANAPRDYESAVFNIWDRLSRGPGDFDDDTFRTVVNWTKTCLAKGRYVEVSAKLDLLSRARQRVDLAVKHLGIPSNPYELGHALHETGRGHALTDVEALMGLRNMVDRIDDEVDTIERVVDLWALGVPPETISVDKPYVDSLPEAPERYLSVFRDLAVGELGDMYDRADEVSIDPYPSDPLMPGVLKDAAELFCRRLAKGPDGKLLKSDLWAKIAQACPEAADPADVSVAVPAVVPGDKVRKALTTRFAFPFSSLTIRSADSVLLVVAKLLLLTVTQDAIDEGRDDEGQDDDLEDSAAFEP